MSDLKLKIEFADKQDSWILNQNSKYVLTADNINEIKTVVNNISDEISNLNMFSDIYKFFRFVVPTGLKEGCEYKLQIELSEHEDFSEQQIPIDINSTDDKEKFNMFVDGTWKNFEEILVDNNPKTTFNVNDIGKSVYVNIKDKLLQVTTYFGRYRWHNVTTNSVSQYFGFVLGAFDFNDNRIEDESREIISEVVTGSSSVKENSSASYEFKVKRRNGEILNLTPSAVFSTSEEGAIVDGNSIHFPKTHFEHSSIVKASMTFENKMLEAYTNVIVHPVKLEKIELVGSTNFSEMRSNDVQQLTVNASYSDESITDVTNSCQVSSSFRSWNYTRNKFSINGTEEELGMLEISYADPDFPALEKTSLTKYIKFIPEKIVELSDNIRTVINYDTMNSDSINYSYVISGTTNYGNISANLTPSAVINVFNGEGITFNNGVMTVDRESLRQNQTVSLLITYPNTTATISKSIQVNGSILQDVLIEINNTNINSDFATFDNVELPFSIYIKKDTSDRFERVNSGFTFKCISSDKVSIVNNETAKKIVIGKFDKNEYVTFLATYTFHGKTVEKYGTILVKSNKIEKIEVLGEFEVDEGVEKLYNVKATYTNGTTENVTSTSKLSLAFGNPSYATIANENPLKITFNQISTANANIAFLAEESTSKKTKAFTVKIKKI